MQIVVAVAPIGRGCFRASVGDRIVVPSSRQPLLDACRALVAEGVDPGAPVVMRHVGSDVDALRSTVAVAAELTVNDTAIGKPIFRLWQSRPIGVNPSPVTSPVRQNEVPATTLAAA